MSDVKKLAVFDLDGTLIRVNSFHRWMAYAACWSMCHGRFDIFAGIVWPSLLRIAGRIDHASMKRRILAATLPLPSTALARFAGRLLHSVNAEVYRYLSSYLRDPEYTVVLVTAAPENYVAPLAQRLGIALFIATPTDIDAPGWSEVVEERKVARLAQTVGRPVAGLDIDVVFTDHHQDLPLLKLATRRYLVTPSARTQDVMKRAGLNDYSVIGA